MSDKHGCSKCHDEDGHGGTFNKWGVRDSKGRDIKITDITKGVFKGGDGPFDLHHRIRHGIPGSMHPANGFYDKDIGETPGWDLAHFVYHISGTTQSNAKQARRPPKELGIPHREDELFESAKKEFFQRPKIQLKTIVPEGWGAFRGTVVFDGRPPSPKKLEVDRKRYGVGEIELVDPSLVVHPKTHGLANVVIWFDREQSETLLPVHDSLSEPPSTPSTLESKQYYFTPHVASVRVGQRLQLGCVDQKATNIHIQSDSRGNGFNMILPMGKTYNYESKASEREPLLVTSSIHPWMKSILVIKDHPYFAVTDANGEFEIPKLPAGKWRFRMWHEIPHKIRKVKFDGGIEVDEFRQFVTIQPDQTITTEIRLAPELFEEPK
ncbi:MAG: carboxypeptidase-like regulatory domain-containing protein [bacterium]|nr:carboxypeptidase-like regulatory domain-containing protein [bacterium]